MAVLQTENLTKVYRTSDGPFTALDSLDLAVNKGEIFGYLGPNGAGKTTTIRMLLDLIRPTAGRATVLDMDSQAQPVEIKQRVGYLPGELALWKNEKASNIINYFARVRGNTDLSYAYELAERLQFDMNKKMRDYSSGNKRKLGLILALMHKPELLILDEPTSGLDPLMQQTFNQLMREARDEGRTVFLSSHVLSEVQAICERVGVLRGGQLKAVERVDALTEAHFRWVTLKLSDATGVENTLQTVEGVSDVARLENGTVKLRLAGDFDPLMRAITDRYVVSVQTTEPSLEEIFLAFYDEQPVDGLIETAEKELAQ
jgi:ABC-2 type transport system ATP-binding protein